MRSVFIALALSLTASLLVWQFLLKKPAIQAASSTAKKPTVLNTPSTDLFRAIAPQMRPDASSRVVDTVSRKHKTVPPKARQSVSSPRIKQRGNTQQNKSRFEKIAFNGERLNKNATRWSCAFDLEFGLLWETKLSNGGISDANHTYSWFNPARTKLQQGKQNGGNCYGSGCDTHAYIKEMNRMALCDSNQWRLPTFSELERLIDRKYYNPTINQNIFPHGKGTVYWSSTELENNPGMVMQVDFFNGGSNAVPKNLSYALRVVSDSP